MADFPAVGVTATVQGINNFLRDMGRMQSGIDTTSSEADKAGGRFGGLGSKIASVGSAAATAAAAGIAAVGAAVVGIGIAGVKTAIEFESAWSGVVKTTDGLVDEMGNLTDAGEEMQQGFRDLAKEVPIAVEELLGIGELGGQLGVGKDDLLSFTETIAAMGVSTNLTTEAAATDLAQLANIMGTTTRLGGEGFERLGSTIVALGNNSATTEADISSFAQRIAGAASVAGVSESSVLGISAAFSSVGIQAQAGGTAVSKVFLDMNKAALEGGDQMEIFAAVAGISADDFGAAWEADAGAVFADFVKGLGMAGDDAIGILDALEIKDSQAVRAFLSLAGAGDLVTDSLAIATKGWDENTALAEEAAKKYATTESQMILFKNTLKDVAITVGQALLPVLNQMLQAAKPLIEEFGRRLPDIINNVLIPAAQAVVEFVSANVIPILASLWDWFSTMLPQAIATASEFWNSVLYPALQQVWTFVQESLIPAFVEFGTFIASILQPIIATFVAFAVENFNIIKAWVDANWPLIQQTIQTVMTAIRDAVQAVLAAVRSFWEENGAAIIAKVQEAWTFIKSVIQAALTFVLGLVKAAMQAINGDWGAAWTTIQETAKAAWEILKTGLTAALNVIKTLVKAALSVLETAFSNAWEAIQTAVDSAIEGIKEKVNSGLKAARSIAEFILNSIKDKVTEIWNAIPGLFEAGINKAKGFITGAVSAFKSAGQAVVDAIKQGIEDAWQGLVDSVKGKLEELTGLLPFSEPKRADSPLRGLSRAGASIVGNISKGLQATLPVLQAQLSAALMPAQQAAPATSLGSTINNVSNITNVNVISNPASQPSEHAIFYDVAAALAGARTG